jgi:dihydrofolate reductase
VQAVKDDTDGDIGMSGCATTVRWLLANGLLDELALLVHPIAVGHGQRLFEDTPTTRCGSCTATRCRAGCCTSATRLPDPPLP